MSTTVEQIKEKISIEELVGSYIELVKAGANFKARCPFHNEKSPSFFITPARGTFYCFGCGEKGDIFTFVEKFENQDFRGALKILADRAGVEIKREDPKVRDEREELFSALEQATLYFQRNLVKNTEALKYLHGRGITSKTMSEWRLGFAENDWRSLFENFSQKGFSPKVLEQAGLIKKTDKGYYDRFRSRIIFPIADSSGRSIGFSGRIFGVEDDAKYLNSPETQLFKKSEILYGMDKAKLEIRKRDFALIVEGQMDLLMAHQAGTTNTIATSGTALTLEHLRLLRRLTNKIVLAFDSDTAGASATGKSAKDALSLGLEVKIVTVTSGKDPADLIKENKEEWLKIIEKPKHIIDFEYDRLEKTIEDRRELGRAIKDKVLPYIKSLDSDVEKSHFIHKIAGRALIKEEALWEDLHKTKSVIETKEMDVKSKLKDKLVRFDYIERRLYGYLMLYKSSGDEDNSQKLVEKISEIVGQEYFDKRLVELKQFEGELILEAEMNLKPKLANDKEIEILIEELKKDRLKKEFAKILDELALAEKNKDKEKASTLMVKLDKLSRELKKG